jgi:hypothetical protein
VRDVTNRRPQLRDVRLFFGAAVEIPATSSFSLRSAQRLTFVWHSLVHFAQFDVEGLELVEDLALVGPDVQLAHQFWHYQEGPPSADLLALEDVAEDVVAHVEDVLALGADQLREDVARTPRIHLFLLEGSRVYAHSEGPSRRVHLSQDGALAEEEGLAGVYHDRVEVRPPVAVGVLGLQTRFDTSGRCYIKKLLAKRQMSLKVTKRI